jgi:hypothetical protein
MLTRILMTKLNVNANQIANWISRSFATRSWVRLANLRNRRAVILATVSLVSATHKQVHNNAMGSAVAWQGVAEHMY